jgi:Uma2 family endonuclease
MAVHLTRRRFTVSEYHQMAEAGILGEDDRVELIDGEVTEMTPIGPRHSACVARLTKHLNRIFGDDAVVWPQNPVDVNEYSEPQPDIVLLRPRPDFYASSHPTSGDVFLIVEVADPSFESDRRIKVPLYARSGILEVWLVDVNQETVTVYREPVPDGYATVRVARRSEPLALAAFPDRALEVADILG